MKLVPKEKPVNSQVFFIYLKEYLKLFCDDPTIEELTKDEDSEWGFGWTFNKGETILSSLEAIKYIEDNNIALAEPIIA